MKKFKPGEVICPTLKSACIEHHCIEYVKLQGVNPNTGQQVDEWKCSRAWIPVLLCEIAQKVNQTSAEISALRSDVRSTEPVPVVVELDNPKLPKVVNN